MFDPVIDSAHEYCDALGQEQAIQDWAEQIIIDALTGPVDERDKMLELLNLSVDEYIEGWEEDADGVAGEYYDVIIKEAENDRYLWN